MQARGQRRNKEMLALAAPPLALFVAIVTMAALDSLEVERPVIMYGSPYPGLRLAIGAPPSSRTAKPAAASEPEAPQELSFDELAAQAWVPVGGKGWRWDPDAAPKAVRLRLIELANQGLVPEGNAWRWDPDVASKAMLARDQPVSAFAFGPEAVALWGSCESVSWPDTSEFICQGLMHS